MQARMNGVKEQLAIHFAFIYEVEGWKFKEERRQVGDPSLISLWTFQ